LIGWKDFSERLHHHRSNGVATTPHHHPPAPRTPLKPEKKASVKHNQVVPIMINTEDQSRRGHGGGGGGGPSTPSSGRPVSAGLGSSGGRSGHNTSAPVTEVVDDGAVAEQQAVASGLVGVVDFFLTRFHVIAAELVTPQDIPFLTLATLLKDCKHHIIASAEILINQTLASSAKLDDDNGDGGGMIGPGGGHGAGIGGVHNTDFPSISLDGVTQGSSGAQVTLSLIRDDERSIRVAQSSAIILHCIQSLYPILAVGLREVNDTLQRRLRAGLTRYIAFLVNKSKRSPVDAPLHHLYLCLASISYLRSFTSAIDASLQVASTRRQSFNTARRTAQAAAAAATAANVRTESDSKSIIGSDSKHGSDTKDGFIVATTPTERKLLATLMDSKQETLSAWMAVSRDAERVTSELVDRVVTVLCEQAKTCLLSGINEADWSKQRDLPDSLHPKITSPSQFLVMWDLFVRGAITDIAQSCSPLIVRTILSRVTLQSSLILKVITLPHSLLVFFFSFIH
jgi:hypothetical protein